MATDQKSRTIEAEDDQIGPAIENELPTYRAISRPAVFSVICGVLAICSFAHSFFYVFALLAVGLGIWANLTIQRHPDMLTGRRLANAGITMGIVFGLASATITYVQNYVRTREAARFGRKLAGILKEPSHANALWYNLHPVFRKTKSPIEVLQEFEGAKGKERMAMDQKTGPLMRLRSLLAASKDEDLNFVRIENIGEDETHGAELNLYALALFELDGPGSKDFPEKQYYALAIIKGRPQGRQYEWWVDDLVFPYKPRSYVAPVKPVDDGHGHGH